MSILRPNSSGLALSSSDWLDTHHAVKTRLRLEAVAGLPIYAGARILDVGCGPGHWCQLFAQKTGSAGKVTGIDVDPEAIRIAKNNACHAPYNAWLNYETCTIEQFLNGSRNFDVITALNILSYVDDPVKLLNNLAPSIDDGGIIILKDTDIGSDFYWPIPENIASEMAALYHSERSANYKDENYDPFFARKLPDIINSSTLKKRDIHVQTYYSSYPVSDENRFYIKNNAKLVERWLSQQGKLAIASEWARIFEDGQRSIFERRDFTYSMNEYFFILSR